VICYRRQGVPTVRMTKSQCKGLARGSRARGTVSRGPLGRPVNVTTVTTFLGTKAVSLARAWKQSVGRAMTPRKKSPGFSLMADASAIGRPNQNLFLRSSRKFAGKHGKIASFSSEHKPRRITTGASSSDLSEGQLYARLSAAYLRAFLRRAFPCEFKWLLRL